MVMSQIAGCVVVSCHLPVNHVIYKHARPTLGKLETGEHVLMVHEIVLCSVKEMMVCWYPVHTVTAVRGRQVQKVVSVRPIRGILATGEHVIITNNLVVSHV